MRTFAFSLAALVGLVAFGCSRTDPAVNETASSKALSKATYLLPAEPAGAKHIFALREKATHLKDGDEIVVVGRIGGSKKPFTGRASFTIVDASLKPCNELEGDTCPVPWDYCCEPPENLAKATLMVKIVDEQGKTLAADAESGLGLKPLQTVVVRGLAQRSENGQITSLHATGLFVRQ